MPKMEADPSTYASVGHGLNSEQMRFVLDNYEAEPEDYPFSIELLDAVTAMAQSGADEAARANGETLQLEEPVQLNLGLTIPEEGYSVSLVKGMPPGLQDFLEPLIRNGKVETQYSVYNDCTLRKGNNPDIITAVCEMTTHPHSQGSWAVYLTQLSGERSPSVSCDLY